MSEKKKQLCMTCCRAKATIFVGKAAFCESCGGKEMLAARDKAVAKLSAPRLKQRDPEAYASQRGAPGGWWNNKER